MQCAPVESGRVARPDYAVLPADGANEYLGATVFVEEHLERFETLCLCHEEAQDDRFAGSRGTDDGEIAEVVMMKIEGVRRARRCFQHRYAVAPIVAEHFALREVMQTCIAGEIAARNFRLARDERKVANASARASRSSRIHQSTLRDSAPDDSRSSRTGAGQYAIKGVWSDSSANHPLRLQNHDHRPSVDTHRSLMQNVHE